MSTYVSVDHPRFVKAQRDIFTRTVTPDCMNHQCRMIREGDGDRLLLDACCQYGVDVDVAERDGIERHRGDIARLLDDEVAGAAWFTGPEIADPDFPSGRHVRTSTHAGGCLFLAHDGRGCAVHRASLEGGWDFRGVKPHVCRLFPLSYESDAIVLSDDYADYSCSRVAGAPSVYRVARDVLAEIFGAELVAALDRVEADVLGARDRLRVIAVS